MLKRKLGIGFLMALVLALVASQVFAGTTTFNVVVPRLGGTTSTNVTTKSTTVQQWAVANIAVGANKTVQFRPYKGSTALAANWINGSTGSQLWNPYSTNQAVGTVIYLKIKTKALEKVSVQVSGYFDSQ
ncbi:MAG: hypothetical protein HZB18_00875 [Chloroflexi bacterium]|nr:hypothetical protein [Chloroflexota bacterium]